MHEGEVMTKMPRVEESSHPGSGERLGREMLVLGGVFVLGAIMTVLDLTVVNVAIPTLGRAFHASIGTIQWVVTGYMLAFASVIPLTGWASVSGRSASGSPRCCSSWSARPWPVRRGRCRR